MSLTQTEGVVKFDTDCAAALRARRDKLRLDLKVCLSFGKGLNEAKLLNRSADSVSASEDCGSSAKGKSSDKSNGSESHGSDWETCLCFLSDGERKVDERGVAGPLEAVIVLRLSSLSSEGADPIIDVVTEAELLSLLPSLVMVFSLFVSFESLNRAFNGVLSAPRAVRPGLPIRPCNVTVFLALPDCREFRGKGIAVASSNAATDGGISA